MKILFYIEPSIVLDNPLCYVPWWGFSFELIMTLLKDKDHEYEILVITNESLKNHIEKECLENLVRVYSIPQEELLKKFNLDYLKATIAWYQEDFDDSQLEHMAGLIKESIQGFIPDVIITFAPVPFLKVIFSEAVILHYELGMISRLPFHRTIYLDPEGMFCHSSLIKYKDDIVNHSIDADQKERITAFRDHYITLIQEKNPFREFLDPIREKYSKILLLPLQFSRIYSFDGLSNFTSQFHYLLSVLSNLPSNIALIVTNHSFCSILTPELVQYLKTRYENFFFTPEFDWFLDVSHFCLGYVDGVISVSSAVGLQTLIWQKKLIVLGDSHLNLIADANDLSNISEVLDAPQKNRDAILHWLLTRYYIPIAYLYEPTWLSRHLTTAVKIHRNHQNYRGLFLPHSDEAELFDLLIQKGFPEIPIKSLRHPSPQTEPDFRQQQITQFIQYADLAAGNEEHDFAIQILENCVKEFPDAREIYPLLAILYSGNQDFAQAEWNLLMALHFDPTNVELINQLGVARYCRGKLSESQQTFSKALLLAPTNREIQNNLIQIVSELENNSKNIH